MSAALGVTLGRGGADSLPCHICAVCTAGKSLFVHNGRELGGVCVDYDQKSTLLWLKVHKTARHVQCYPCMVAIHSL